MAKTILHGENQDNQETSILVVPCGTQSHGCAVSCMHAGHTVLAQHIESKCHCLTDYHSTSSGEACLLYKEVKHSLRLSSY